MKIRKGENEGNIFRSKRIFSENGVWLFMTREGVNKGPFESLKVAENELDSYISNLEIDSIECKEFDGYEIKGIENDVVN